MTAYYEQQTVDKSVPVPSDEVCNVLDSIKSGAEHLFTQIYKSTTTAMNGDACKNQNRYRNLNVIYNIFDFYK